jgi:hypothetical protein
LITAVDRAAKAGHLECLKAIKEFGGIIDRRRRNGMNTAHGAAMCGHQEALEWLQVGVQDGHDLKERHEWVAAAE